MPMFVNVPTKRNKAQTRQLSPTARNQCLTVIAALCFIPCCGHINAGFRLTCRLPHCCFDDDICSTAQASLAAEGWPSGKQRQTNRSITLPLCPPRQIADSRILFNSGAMSLGDGDKAKAALPLRAATLKQQAMITRHSDNAASGKLVWNQHYEHYPISTIRQKGKMQSHHSISSFHVNWLVIQNLVGCRIWKTWH